LITPHGFHPNGFHPQPLALSEGNWWVAAVLFSSFTILVILRVFDFKRLLQLMNGFLRSSSVSVLYREEYSLTSRVSVLLLFNYLLMFPLFIWQTARLWGPAGVGLQGFGLIICGTAIAYFLKITTTRMLGNIFEVREAAAEYTYNVLLFNKTAGLVLFPICLLLAYARQIPPEILVWCGIVSWGLILIYRLLRVVLIGIANSGVSFFYIMLYLCTLEIIPFIVIIKVFVGTFQSFNP
jgi:hypothetical protein